MSYLNIYGNYEEQKQAIKLAEEELFFRKVSLIFHLVDELNKYGTSLFLDIQPEFKKVTFFVRNKHITKRHNNSVYGLLLDLDSFELPENFIEDYNEVLNSLFAFEEQFQYKNVFSKNTLIEVKLNNLDWIKYLFLFLEKEQLESKYLNQIFDKILSKNNDTNTIVKV